MNYTDRDNADNIQKKKSAKDVTIMEIFNVGHSSVV